jgi:hypothetical protein
MDSRFVQKSWSLVPMWEESIPEPGASFVKFSSGIIIMSHKNSVHKLRKNTIFARLKFMNHFSQDIVMTNEEFLEKLDAIINERHMLQHPFYQMWNTGDLTIQMLREYALEYYQQVHHFPTYGSTPDVA